MKEDETEAEIKKAFKQLEKDHNKFTEEMRKRESMLAERIGVLWGRIERMKEK